MNPNQRGAIAEANVKAHFIEAGLDVFEPIRDDCRIDLVVDIDGDLTRVQVKSAHFTGEKVKFKTRSCMSHKSHGSDGQNYVGVVDGFAVYCPELDECYWVDIDDAPNSAMELRVEDADSNHPAINWADEYKLGENIA